MTTRGAGSFFSAPRGGVLLRRFRNPLFAARSFALFLGASLAARSLRSAFAAEPDYTAGINELAALKRKKLGCLTTPGHLNFAALAFPDAADAAAVNGGAVAPERMM